MRRSARIETERRSASFPRLRGWKVDPWQEAASLALMPKATAAVRLTALIAALPDEQTKDIPVKSIAADLVALLPKANGFDVRSTSSVIAAVDTGKLKTVPS